MTQETKSKFENQKSKIPRVPPLLTLQSKFKIQNSKIPWTLSRLYPVSIPQSKIQNRKSKIPEIQIPAPGICISVSPCPTPSSSACSTSSTASKAPASPPSNSSKTAAPAPAPKKPSSNPTCATRRRFLQSHRRMVGNRTLPLRLPNRPRPPRTRSNHRKIRRVQSLRRHQPRT